MRQVLSTKCDKNRVVKIQDNENIIAACVVLSVFFFKVPPIFFYTIKTSKLATWVLAVNISSGNSGCNQW